MKLSTKEPRIMALKNCSSHTLSRALTWTKYNVVTYKGQRQKKTRKKKALKTEQNLTKAWENGTLQSQEGS